MKVAHLLAADAMQLRPGAAQLTCHGRLFMADDIRPEKPSEADIEAVDQDPGERQRENQNFEKDDPLAA